MDELCQLIKEHISFSYASSFSVTFSSRDTVTTIILYFAGSAWRSLFAIFAEGEKLRLSPMFPSVSLWSRELLILFSSSTAYRISLNFLIIFSSWFYIFLILALNSTPCFSKFRFISYSSLLRRISFLALYLRNTVLKLLALFLIIRFVSLIYAIF